MPKGGKREGAGRPKGSSTFFKRGDIPEKFANRVIAKLERAIDCGNPKREDWAIEVIMPYAFRKQPQSTEITGQLGVSHEFTQSFTSVFGGGQGPVAPVSGEVADGPGAAEDSKQG
jgi:hypothetical protein